ncbi:unnamed protein product, partial [Sphagnum jensenii]
SRKQPKHPSAMEAHLHGKHPHPKCPTKRKKRTTQNQRGPLKSSCHQKGNKSHGEG